MIPYQSTMTVWIFVEIIPLVIILEIRVRKLSLLSKLRTDSLRGFGVKVCLQRKTLNLKNDIKRILNIDKNIAPIKEVWYEEIACRVPRQTLAIHNLEVCAAEDRWHRNSQQTTWLRNKKWKKLLSYYWTTLLYNFSNILLILYVKYFYNQLRLKVVIDKCYNGATFFRTQCIMVLTSSQVPKQTA